MNDNGQTFDEWYDVLFEDLQEYDVILDDLDDLLDLEECWMECFTALDVLYELYGEA